MIVKILLAFLTLPLIMAISIVGLIYGWGLEPVNWWWIIGTYAAVAIIGGLTQSLSA